jgi:alpha-N-arabinofuranosidase
VVNTIVNGIGNFVVTATDPSGPWSDPVTLPIEGIDPSLFFDDDGKSYLVNNGNPDYEPLYSGHRAIWIQEFDKDNLKLVGPRKVIIDGGVDIRKKPIWIEGPHLYKISGNYYLCAAEGGTSVNHSQVIFRSKNVWGPYEPWEHNPILTQRHLNPKRPNPVTCTGHADLFETQTGEWWSVFLGCTPYADDFYNTGRQTFLLPVIWKNDWPVILAENSTVPYLSFKPNLSEQDSSSIPLNGNFSLRDEFSDTSLSMVWNFIRTPHEKWYTLKKDKLTIRARDQAINHISQPSFIGRRQQHHFCSATTSMQFKPANVGDKAGLVVFQNEDHYYMIAITKKTEGSFIILEKGAASGPEEKEIKPVKLSGNQEIFLKIEARGRFYDFYYSLVQGQWELLGKDLDATWLSTHVAGGFVGAYFGMYAYSPVK